MLTLMDGVWIAAILAVLWYFMDAQAKTDKAHRQEMEEYQRSIKHLIAELRRLRDGQGPRA